MKIKLDDYVYRNLQKYRNCYIDSKIYDKFGEKLLLLELKKKGYNCSISEHKDYYTDIYGCKNYEKDYIIEVL